MNTLKTRLEQFHQKHNYLPGTLEFLIKQSWADELTLQSELDRALAQLRHLAKLPYADIAALTKNERAFLKAFDHQHQ